MADQNIEIKVNDVLENFFKATASFHSVIQKELQKRSLRNQRYEPEPGRPVANLSRDSYDSGLNQLYGTGKERQTWAMLVPVKDPTLTIYGTSMTFKKSDDGKSGFGFPNQSSPYSGLASRYQVPTASPYSFLDGNTLYNSLDDSLKDKLGDVLFTEYPSVSYRPNPGLTSIAVDATQVLTNTAKVSAKLFSMYQVDLLSHSMLKLGSQFIIMFGYSTITQEFLTEQVYDSDGVFHVNPDNRHTIPIATGGNMCYYEVNLTTFDIAFNGDDASFDLSMDFTGIGSAGIGDNTVKEKIITLKDVKKEVDAPQDAEAEKKEIAASIIKNKDTFKKWISVLERGGTEEEKQKKGVSNLVFPDSKMLLEIGSGRETDMLSLEEDAAAQLGFQDDESVTVQGREIEKKQRHIDAIYNINREFEFPTEYNFAIPGYELPLDGKKLAVSVKMGGKDEKENTRVEGKPEDFGITYIPWGVCEWLLNNGIFDKEAQLEILPQKFGQYIPQEAKIARDLPAIPPVTQEEAHRHNSGTAPGVNIEPHPGSPAVEGSYIIERPPSFINFLQSCRIPKKMIKKEGSNQRVHFPRSHRMYAGKMQDPGPMSHLKEDLKEDGKSLIMSTIISNHRNLFSANPEICLLPGQIPQPEDEEVGGLELDSSEVWPPFAVNDKKTLGFLRNILINSEFFYEVVYESGLDSVAILEKIWAEVNTACGDFWEDLNPGFSDTIGGDDKMISVKEKLPKKGQKPTKREMITAVGNYYVYEEDGVQYKYHEDAFPIVNFGRDSIVREMTTTIEVSSDLATIRLYENLELDNTKLQNDADSIEKIQKEIDVLKTSPEQTEAIQEDIQIKEKTIKDIITKRESEVGKFKDYESLLIDSAGRTLAKMKPTGNDYSFSPNIILEAKQKLMKLITVGDFALNQEVLVNSNATPLPLKVTIKLDGISGINQNETCVLTYVPAEYSALQGVFRVTNVKHDLSDDGWQTELELLFEKGESTKADVSAQS